jgi:hypothetical protein
MEFDLLVALPELLPSAIAWAELQSRRVTEEGDPLGESDQSMAGEVDVRRPELIRVMLVDRIPMPDNSFLKRAAIETDLLGPHTAGLTLGHSILIVKEAMNLRILSHECRHVYQYERYGSIRAFLPIYLRQIATVGYADAPLELDARAHER